MGWILIYACHLFPKYFLSDTFFQPALKANNKYFITFVLGSGKIGGVVQEKGTDQRSWPGAGAGVGERWRGAEVRSSIDELDVCSRMDPDVA